MYKNVQKIIQSLLTTHLQKVLDLGVLCYLTNVYENVAITLQLLPVAWTWSCARDTGASIAIMPLELELPITRGRSRMYSAAIMFDNREIHFCHGTRRG